MAKVLVANHVTLDGVMQGPAGPDEDPRDGFAQGGWAARGSHPDLPRKIGERMAGERAFLLGRRTYEQFFGVWAPRVGDPFGDALTNTTKYVASRTLTDPLPWANSVLLDGDATDAVAKLRSELEAVLVIFGSGELIRSLAAADLIDEYLLMIHPLVLGSGRRLFGAGDHAQLRLVETAIAPTGVIAAVYEPLRGDTP